MTRPSSLPLALVSTLLLALPAAADDDTGWEQINREDGITVFTKEVAGSDLIAVKGVTTIEQPLGKVLSVLMTHQRWSEWVDRMSGSKILKTFNTYDYVVYQAFDLPFVCSDRDFVYRGTVTSDEEGQVFLTMQSCEWKSAPETVGVRAELLHSRYVLTPKGENRTRVEVEIHTDPKGLIPSWLVNQLQKSWPVSTLGGVREQAKRKDIELFPPPPPSKPEAEAKEEAAEEPAAGAKPG